jgi:hypothetical protein
VTASPNESSTLEEWKAWVHDHEDLYFRNVVLDSRMLLTLVKDLRDARESVVRIQKMWDEERNRL